jgi:3-methyladenine DNA glycosylase AlkD
VGTPERARQERRYLRSALEHLGATLPATRRAVAAVRRASPDLDRATLRALVEALWARGIFECRMAAVDLLELFLDRLLPEDLALVERLLRDSGTWALVDSLAASVAGPLAARLPRSDRTLERWAKDPDFWIRRSALLALLLPLREGSGDLARFGRLADPMLGEKEFFVRKAIGWVLRDAGRRDPAGVAAWLLPRAARASGLTVREAVKHLPAARRTEILAAHRGRVTSRPGR